MKNDKINDKINDVDKEILMCINNNKYITIPQLSEKIGKSIATIYRHIDELVSKGMLKRIGSRKSGYWEVNR